MRIVSRIAFVFAVAGIALAAFYSTGCNTNGGINVDIAKDAFEKLSDYNFFKGKMADLVPNDGLLPYDLNSTLFSDYAEKARFVWVPKEALTADGATNYDERGLVNLPVGAVLVKNFYYPVDFRDAAKGRRIMETRLLIHRESGWEAETYVWNDEQTEAVREIAGAQKPVSFINAKGEKVNVTYGVPNKNQCLGCHEMGGKFTPIGPKVGNLDRDYNYAEAKQNQLTKWASLGYITGLPKKAGTIHTYPVWNNPATGSLDERARAYLDINCAHCHNPKGPAKNSGLDLSFTNRDALSYGIGKAPIAAGAGSGDNMIDIAPGHPENSILNYRLESTNPEVMMPELGRTIVHTEGVELIREWVASMTVSQP